MHLYVHVPFCQRRCSYCDFSIAVRKRIPVREYLDSLLKEAGSLDLASLETIYFGGGTPSLLPPETIAMLLHELTSPRRTPHAVTSHVVPPHAARDVDVSRRTPHAVTSHVVPPHAAREVTLEANPEDVTPSNARAWASAGVNRVSLGAQSFDDTVLQWMHRSHDAARIGGAVHALRGAGIDNISLDLIFALPDELQRDWERDLDMALALRPTHLSLYGLTVEPRTPLDRWISRGATRVPDDDRYAEEYLTAYRRLTTENYQFYEVSNASLPGFHCRHNSAYWSGQPYVGLGPAAHSFDGTTRRWNLRAWEAYRRAIAEGRSPVESEETLTDEQSELERIYLGLRTADGVAVAALRRPSPPPYLAAQGWVVEHNGRLRCTPEGWLRLDSLVHELTMQAEIRS